MQDKRLRDGYGKHRKPVTITIMDGEVVAKVSLGRKLMMIIDLADIDILNEHSFYAHKRADGQVVARSSQTGLYAHRIILQAMSSDVDHVNHQPLDNRKVNLRECSSMQNQLAREHQQLDGFYGLYKIQDYSEENKYVRGRLTTIIHYDVWGYFKPDGRKSRERFKDILDAACARDNAYMEYYKDSHDVWHTYNFINWNHPTDDKLRKINPFNQCSPYIKWLRNTAKEQNKKALKWLNNTRWGFEWYMTHINSGVMNFTPHEGELYMES